MKLVFISIDLVQNVLRKGIRKQFTITLNILSAKYVTEQIRYIKSKVIHLTKYREHKLYFEWKCPQGSHTSGAVFRRCEQINVRFHLNWRKIGHTKVN